MILQQLNIQDRLTYLRLTEKVLINLVLKSRVKAFMSPPLYKTHQDSIDLNPSLPTKPYQLIVPFSFKPFTLVSLETLTSKTDHLTVEQEPTRGLYHFHYNQSITRTLGPTVIQLPIQSTSPWWDNIWYQQILRDAQNNILANFSRDTSSSYYSSPTMSAFEVEGNPPYDEKPTASRNFVDNPLFIHDSWSTSVNPSSGESLLPPVRPKLPTAAADMGGQYINPFTQPMVQNRPQSTEGQNFIPMNSAYTETDLPYEGQVIPTRHNTGNQRQVNLGQPLTLVQKWEMKKIG